MAALLAFLLSVCLKVALVGAATALPSEQSCTDKYNKIGQNALLARLSPCRSGITSECCTAGQALAGASGDFAYCLCIPKLLDQIISTTESNSLAKAAGSLVDARLGQNEVCFQSKSF